ncbi:hypothetical protein [Sporosarcina sp. P3]|uniref:hypothetical protein n=1 Tax=Sporosarcina sp. P3 TaxID=2048245 RepID=UPI00117B2EFC|nr:hypothetical protein [Sporosarcina sp. P3]
MGILLALLFILQIIGFLIMTLLYVKISKFNNLEKKQQQLMKEMDQSILAYLEEIKEENDRLIHQLNQRTEDQMEHTSNLAPREQSTSKSVEVPEPQPKPHPVPVHFALRSYQKMAEIEKGEKETKPDSNLKPLSDRQKAKQLYAEGTPIVDIARELKKGKTEIELLLKFD